MSYLLLVVLPLITVALLSGNAGERKKLKHIFAGKKMSFRKKFAIRQMLGNPARTFVIFMGIFVGSYIMLFGLGFFDTMQSVADKSSERLGSFEYEYVLNELLAEEAYDGEPILASSLETEKGSSLSLIGTDNDDRYCDEKLWYYDSSDGVKLFWFTRKATEKSKESKHGGKFKG